MIVLHVVFIAPLAVMAVVLWSLSAVSVKSGAARMVGLSVVLISPVLILLTGLIVERRSLAQLVTLRGSWALMFGDLALAVGMTWTAKGMRQLALPSGGYLLRAASVSVAAGTSAGISFHHVDGGNYRADGFGALVNTSTKQAHDYVTLPYLFALVLFIFLMLCGARRASREASVMRRRAVFARFGLSGLAWAGFYVRDMRIGLDPQVLHGGAAAPTLVNVLLLLGVVFALVVGCVALASREPSPRMPTQ